MILPSDYWLKTFGVLFGATLVAYLAQTIVDSGTINYKRLFLNLLIANFSYLISFFLLYKKKYSRVLFSIITVAVVGTVINTICVTISDSYFDYWSAKDNGVLNFSEFFKDYLKTFILRLLVFVPIDSIIFSITAVSFYFTLKFFDKMLKKSK